jgi:hypothetical protein
VDLAGQVYYRLVVHVGPVPSVRLVWKPEAELAREIGVAAVGATEPGEVMATSGMGLGRSSFFEPRPAPVLPVPSVPAKPVVSAEPAVAGQKAVQAAGVAGPGAVERRKDWGRSALERFKTMPGASKYSGAGGG